MKVICFGDSNTWGYDPRARFGESYPRRWTDILSANTGWEVINEGVNGRQVPNEPVTIPADTDLFLVMLGTNDLLQLDTPEAAAQRMERFLSGADVQKVVLIAPPSMVWGAWVQDQGLIDDSVCMAQLFQELAYRMGIQYFDAGEWNIPLCEDGVHFTGDGQTVFAEKLEKAL